MRPAPPHLSSDTTSYFDPIQIISDWLQYLGINNHEAHLNESSRKVVAAFPKFQQGLSNCHAILWDMEFVVDNVRFQQHSQPF